jgi:hypothetical protein
MVPSLACPMPFNELRVLLGLSRPKLLPCNSQYDHASKLEIADGTFELSTAKDKTLSSVGCRYLSVCKM